MIKIFNMRSKNFTNEESAHFSPDDFSPDDFASLNRIFFEFEILAREWRAFSSVVNGYKTMYYGGRPKLIRCYFSELLDHSTVTMGGVEVSFHSPPTISGFTLGSCQSVEKIMIQARALLASEIDKVSNPSTKTSLDYMFGLCRQMMQATQIRK